jgi:DNA (cytosine-5)-methyltransferase 1
VRNKRYTYVDLFSGAGGLSLGLESEGFKNIFSLDIERSFCDTYRQNFPSHVLLEQNIATLTKKGIEDIVSL